MVRQWGSSFGQSCRIASRATTARIALTTVQRRQTIAPGEICPTATRAAMTLPAQNSTASDSISHALCPGPWVQFFTIVCKSDPGPLLYRFGAGRIAVG